MIITVTIKTFIFCFIAFLEALILLAAVCAILCWNKKVLVLWLQHLTTFKIHHNCNYQE